MKHLLYTNYMSGHAGLSNGIMSIEIGVILAHLTNRFLLLAGNKPPPANIVSYDGRVTNQRPSRITDLIDIPVPWAELESFDLGELDSVELTSHSLGDVAFYFPGTLDLSSADARRFARGRDQWLTVGEELDEFPVLRVSEDPFVPGGDAANRHHRNNLCFYSYQFYLNDELRRSVYRVLEHMRPKPPFADLAKRVAADIGTFNAVHLRRGDFKVTYGVTTLERQSWEAIEALDQVFDRKDPLVIVTDERDDPFFREITLAYPQHVFIDWHILDEYTAELAHLPQADSLSLAYLSQLVAAESMNFIGTMTSTFTALIQRYRGNRSKDEPFRFLWNELPTPGAPFERGRHAISDCVALDRGVMVEEFEGPYSWNRVNQRINPAWMREWPESFLTLQTIATGALAAAPAVRTRALSSTRGDGSAAVVYLTFENLQIAVRSRNAEQLHRVGLGFGASSGEPASHVIAELEIVFTGGNHIVLQDGQQVGEAADEMQLSELVKRLGVPMLARARRRHTWLRGAAFARAGRALVVAGNLGDGSLVEAMQSANWDLIEEGAVAIRIDDHLVLPFGASDRPEGAAGYRRRLPAPATHLVVATQQLFGRNTLAPISPAVAVAELITTSLDFPVDRDRAVERLCRLVERRPVAQLRFSTSKPAAQLISAWADPVDREAAS